MVVVVHMHIGKLFTPIVQVVNKAQGLSALFLLCVRPPAFECPLTILGLSN